PLLLIGLVAVTIVGTVGVVEYRVWSRLRTARQAQGLVPLTPANGLPPAGASAPGAASMPSSQPPTEGPAEPPL
ncbi:MAG: hypothetical protein L3J96_04090, partial [Thermoplasmata archaeon]|nr:hypothetical protein [Thermoplasmata archaeon]